MAAVRKSDISKTGTGFRDASTPSIRSRKRRGTHLRSGVRNPGLGSTPTLSVPTQKQRHSSKNLSLPIMTRIQNREKTAVPNYRSQSSPPLRSSKSEFVNVPVVPTSKAMPLWLMRLYTLHRHSSLVAFLLVAASLAVYGLTVYTQELWGQGYRRLQNLQRYERQITTTNATLTNKMAEEAELPATGLVSPTPSNTIFLSPSPPNSDVLSPSPETESPVQSSTSSPLGY
ncbi:hypothetical protein Nos7524_5410 [Nostoc sp. PCC 7524]|uniref:hypothetical protein n=1 Tax=Nostoc sp. (strain ATCC 29411 / PCC 7524) TaxID=28072 RepID=UPI00029F151B|nr:hypothetical protein [Nostoc sp. PCC 7524]AFY51127.1 hypothetical protein Nos7524_5410 [Nostoc sp. PCC 7524]